MTMGEKIRTLRKAKGMTLEQVGDLVGVGKSTVRKWENGMIANMRRDKIAKLSMALGTTPAYLMGWEPLENRPAETKSKTDTDEVITDSERLLLKYYRSITEEKQIALLQFLGIEEDQK